MKASAADDRAWTRGPAHGPASLRDGRGGIPGAVEPCVRCNVLLPRRLMGCKGGHCPNCAHPYPHGDCSD